MTSPRYAGFLADYCAMAQSVMRASTLDALVDALAAAMEPLGLANNADARRTRTLAEATRLAIHRVASGAGNGAELSGLRRMLRMLAPASADGGGNADNGVEAWMSLVAAGTANLRSAYLASLLQSARALDGGNVVAISDLSGEALPVQAVGRGNRDTVTDRVTAQAGQVLQSAVRSIRSAGVLGVGRFRMTRLDRPSRTLVDSAVDFERSPTGLPAMVVRAHEVESFDALPEPAPLAPAGPGVGLETRMALRVAG